MPGKRSAESLKRCSEKGARHVYAALQRRETTVAIREVAARRREDGARERDERFLRRPAVGRVGQRQGQLPRDVRDLHHGAR